MYKFSNTSKQRLATCHPEIQLLMNEVIKEVDITIIEGNRPVERQQQLYAQGRTAPGKIVTQIDGVTRLGKHNHTPSLAVDIARYPIDWGHTSGFVSLNKIVEKVWNRLKNEGKVKSTLVWGGNWPNFKDYPHYELS
jgi:peptidoglycan L-alanyl-D-glutamate endopeptidase CwlK